MTARRQKVVIEYHGAAEWWVMFDDGQVEVFDTDARALRAVQRAAHRRNAAITITRIEWRDTPAGWTAPALAGSAGAR